MTEDIRVRRADLRSDQDQCVRLQRAVWGLSDLEVVSAVQITSALLAGGSLHVAETAAGEIAGFAFAVPAIANGVAHLHSDMLAVLPQHQQRGIGVRLKWAQRADALARGIKLITWTFDPMQARNASLNLRRLGAVATEFLENLYGITSASLHHGLPTDRLLVRWTLDEPRVQALSAQDQHAAVLGAPASPRINDVKWQAGWPVSTEPRLGLQDPELLLEIPPEWDVLFQSAPRVAEQWQAKVRAALKDAMGRGYRAEDFIPAQGDGGRRRPLYVLRRSA